MRWGALPRWLRLLIWAFRGTVTLRVGDRTWNQRVTFREAWAGQLR